MHKALFLFLFQLLFCTLTLQAQLPRGTTLIGPSVNVNYTDQNQTQYYDNPNRKTITNSFNQSYGITLPYGYFRKENVMVSIGLSYTYSDSRNRTDDIDTNYYRFNLTNTESNFIGIVGNIYHFYPLKNSFGVYHSEGLTMGYSRTAGISRSVNNSPEIFVTGVPSNVASLTGTVLVGIYYRVSDHFLLIGGLNLFSLTASYTWQQGTDSRNKDVDNNTLSIVSNGTLSPNSSLGNIQIGVRYILPPRVVRQ